MIRIGSNTKEREILYHIELFLVFQGKAGKYKYIRPVLPHIEMGEEFVNKYKKFFDEVTDYLISKDWTIVIKGYNHNQPMNLR